MRTKLVYSSIEDSLGYGAGSGNTERYEYECPCGSGKVVEEHDNIPGFRDHDVYISCEKCKRKYILDISKGIRNLGTCGKIIFYKQNEMELMLIIYIGDDT